MSHKHNNSPQPQRQTNLIEYSYAKALISVENQEVKNGNALLTRGRIVSEKDIRYQMWIEHLNSIGVDVREYGTNANLLSYAYTPRIPDNGLREEIITVLAPAGKTNSENTNIVLAQPQQENEQ